MSVPNIQINTSISSCGNNRAQRNEIKKIDRTSTKNCLEILIPFLKITSVFGNNYLLSLK